jgi:2-keto-4-pentenoate hydratase
LKGDAVVLARDYLARRPSTRARPGLTLDQAETVQREFLRRITRGRRGLEVAGYKAALTSAQARESFGVGEPVRGTLFAHMLHPNDALLSPRAGARLMVEGDLVIRVGSELINRASSAMEMLSYVDAVIPFLEVPDLVYDPSVALSGAGIAAINAGARAGVLGEAVPITNTTEWYHRLGAVRVEIRDGSGRVVAEGHGSNLMGHPLKSVLWLRDSLAEDGIRLYPGDLLSLGSMTRLLKVEPGGEYTALYHGLTQDDPLPVRVRFKPR